MSTETIAAILFLVFLTLFLIKNRKKLVIQKAVWPLLYIAMYKTKLGLRQMNSLARNHPRLIRILSNLGVVFGTAGIILIAFLLLKNLYDMSFAAAAGQGVALVLPFKVKGGFFVPFFYWIISIFVIAAIHEFSHGVAARAHNVSIKSSGFAFLCAIIPIIPAAFVEPNEKTLAKKKAMQKLSVFAAGPFSNIITGIMFLALFIVLSYPIAAYVSETNGVSIESFTNNSGAKEAGIPKGSIIKEINGIEILAVSNLSDALKGRKVNDVVYIKTDNETYNVTLTKNPNNESLPYLGVLVSQSFATKPGFKEKFGDGAASFIMWLMGLLYWLYLLSVGIGLFNLVPIGPIDGGRMSKEFFSKIFKDREKVLKAWGYTSFIFLIIIVLNLLSGFF